MNECEDERCGMWNLSVRSEKTKQTGIGGCNGMEFLSISCVRGIYLSSVVE